ncbi:hypothetical protein FRZ03_00875 [Streptomyces misionensis]|uniref:Uncharacterized protein n=1 Tax=Streptomyces misionensis TaxID=67331 RepID=A0A5C6K4X6_9ACTN|nr:hypothetical protein [Streptomyces misionensis]TWV58277.1 hypothetical protein FRZ03_00875 [Streptomyces misionensis]
MWAEPLFTGVRAGRGTDATSSASAEAGRGIDGRGRGGRRQDARPGVGTLGGDGRAANRGTARDPAGLAKSFAILADFTDRAGNLPDVVVVLAGPHGGARATVGATPPS